MRSRTGIYALLDILGVILIFSIFLLLRAEPFVTALNRYLYSFLLFLGIWLLVSIFSKKYNHATATRMSSVIGNIILANIIVLGIATTLMYLVRVDYYSRTIVFGTILTATVLELIWAILDFLVRTAVTEPSEAAGKKISRRRTLLKNGLLAKRTQRRTKSFKTREDAILVEINQEAFDYIFSFARIDSPETLVISSTNRFNIETQLKDHFEAIVNLRRINDIRYVNKFFETANARLPVGGLFIDFVETKNLRKKRILRKFPPGINYIAYFFDYIIKRVFPKFIITKKLYFFLTRGQNRVFTKAETFGRLYSCGFEILDEKFIAGHLFFVARKVRKPHFPENPTYGPFVKLERIGYEGKKIRVYKLRTMHPYAEYLQEYIYNMQGLDEGGKFRSDFRISTLGRILRTFWLDEFPMLLNWVKGDLKLVGVRPLSEQYFKLYSRELQEKRIKYKPGLIPPFYADNPKTLDEIMESEIRYMEAYKKSPFLTDFRYFFRAGFNILFKRYRSR
jgi:lipopolysaccharide/colanic/teichoic acid biosynthesis glycosyltransferase